MSEDKSAMMQAVLVELVRLYDWRKEVGATITDSQARQYGAEKKAAWVAAKAVLASHAEREGAVATVTDEDGTVRPVCTGEPSPAPDSQAEELVEITRYRCATVRTAMKPETAHGEMIPIEIGEWVRYIDVETLLRSRQAPRGNAYRRVKIEALRALGPNWNSYDCEAFSKESVDAALALEPRIPAEFVSIVPVAGGGVQFGKNGDEVTIEVYASTHPQSGEDDTQIRKLMEGE